jgi:hypothetical protein
MGAGLQHPCEGSVHVVAPQAHLHGVARARHVEPVNLSRRDSRGDAEYETERSHFDVLGCAFGGSTVRLLKTERSVLKNVV